MTNSLRFECFLKNVILFLLLTIISIILDSLQSLHIVKGELKKAAPKREMVMWSQRG